MLLGALMVLAPTAGADDVPVAIPTQVIYDSNVHCGSASGKVPGLGYSNGIKFDGSAAKGLAGANGVSYTRVEGTPLTFNWVSTTHDILAVIVKQANGAAVYNYPSPGAKAGQVYVATGKDTTGVSHIDFCYDSETPDPTGRLIVRKDVAPDPVGDPEFGFTIDGPADFDYDFMLGDGDADDSVVPAGQYVIAESDPGPGHTLEGVTCAVNQEALNPPVTNRSVTVTVPQGATVDCTFTNTPVTEPDEPGLTVEKVVTGNGKPSSWEFDFEICDSEEPVLTAAAVATDEGDTCSEFTLTDEEPTAEFPAGDYDVTELDDGALKSIVCTDESDDVVGSPDGSTVYRVDVSEEDVTCVFTNDFPPPPPPPGCVTGCITTLPDCLVNCTPPPPPLVECPAETPNWVDTNGDDEIQVEECNEVLPTPPLEPTDPEPTDPEPTDPEPEIKPAAQESKVLGVQTVRTLPRTGDETGNLAGAGALMLALGAALVLASKRQLAQR